MSKQQNAEKNAIDTESEIPVKKRKDISADAAKEFGGRDGPEPTRYGDWEKNGIISDF